MTFKKRNSLFLRPIVYSLVDNEGAVVTPKLRSPIYFKLDPIFYPIFSWRDFISLCEFPINKSFDPFSLFLQTYFFLHSIIDVRGARERTPRQQDNNLIDSLKKHLSEVADLGSIRCEILMHKIISNDFWFKITFFNYRFIYISNYY